MAIEFVLCKSFEVNRLNVSLWCIDQLTSNHPNTVTSAAEEFNVWHSASASRARTTHVCNVSFLHRT